LGDSVRVEEEGAQIGEGSTRKSIQVEEEEDGTKICSTTSVFITTENQKDKNGENIGEEEADEIKDEISEPVRKELKTHDELKILGVKFTFLDDE